MGFSNEKLLKSDSTKMTVELNMSIEWGKMF